MTAVRAWAARSLRSVHNKKETDTAFLNCAGRIVVRILRKCRLCFAINGSKGLSGKRPTQTRPIASTDNAVERIAVFHGPTPIEKREVDQTCLQRAPIKKSAPHPSLQRRCRGRTESPGSLLQYCHYFVYTQRLEDRVLHALVKKTKIIQEQLGSLSQAIDSRLSKLLKDGITRADTGRLVDEIDAADLDKKGRGRRGRT